MVAAAPQGFVVPKPNSSPFDLFGGALLLGLTLFGCGEGEAAPPRQGAAGTGPAGAPVAGAAADLGEAPLGPGWVIWEAATAGDSGARIFGRPLDGSPARQLSREESGREHCCGHLSPDGNFFVYLSLSPQDARYPQRPAAGELRLHQLADGVERVLAERARTYFEHRAVVFRDAGHLIYIDDTGRSRELTLDSGASRVLVEGPLGDHGWLLDPQLRFATQGTPTFSPYDAASRKVQARPTLGGCQPYFTGDGRFGFYVAGAGGPLRSLELATRQKREILRKGDARLPSDRRYLYFPMISRDGTLLVWGASNGGHDHFAADYDIFLAELDPATLQLAGKPLRVTKSKGAERFPDVWAPAGVRPRPVAPAEPPAPPAASESGGLAVPGQVLVFRGGDHSNPVIDRATGAEVSTVFEPRGRAFFDRNFALDLRGGSFLADQGTMERLLEGVKATNEMSLELFFEAAPGFAQRAVLFTFSAGRGGARRNFTVAREGERLKLQLLTESNSAGGGGSTPQLDLGAAPAGKPQHLLLSYSPGELVAYVNGRETARAQDWREGFFPWQSLPLLFGNEWEAAEPFQGKIYRATVWDHLLGEGAAAELASAAAAELAARPAPPTLRIKARLLARSRTPRLEEIAPYRQSLAVYEYQVLAVLEGKPAVAGEKLRVVHRVLEDGESLPINRFAEGRELELTLEPYKDQPQLESLFLSDQLPPSDAPLYFSLAIDFE